MVTRIPPALLSFLISILIICPSIPGFAKTFTSNQGRFSINFPGNPKKTQTVHKRFTGDIKETTYRLDTKYGNYSVGYSDLSAMATVLGGAKTILKKAKAGLLKNAKGREISFKIEEYKGYPAGILEFQVPPVGSKTAMHGMARLYLVDSRLFVLVGTRRQGFSLKPLEQFLDSFKLLKI